MLPATIVSIIIALLLAAFFTVNAYNVFIIGKRRNGGSYAEVERPTSPIMALTTSCTLIFFLEALLLVFKGFFGMNLGILEYFQLKFPFDSTLQIIGLGIMGCGFLIFIWSVIARGKYSVSWAMPKDQVLVTWGPFHHVRHPSYLGYSLMFIGLPLVVLNPVALVPLLGIPGYILAAEREEELLMERFGKAYEEYKAKTGGFLPRFRTGE